MRAGCGFKSRRRCHDATAPKHGREQTNQQERGSFGVGAPTDTVREISGAQPEDFETIVRRYVANSPFARRTMGRTAKAAWNLAKAMMTAAPDVDALAEKSSIRTDRMELERIS